MRVKQEGCFIVPVRDVRGSANAPLENTQTKPKRRPKKYRAVERPDGMIVEWPRYRPAASSQNASPKPSQTLVDPRISTNQAGRTKPSRTTYELLGISMSETNSSTASHNSVEEIRQGGDGQIQFQYVLIEIDKYTVERQNHVERNTIDRFLYDKGPWSSYSQRESN